MPRGTVAIGRRPGDIVLHGNPGISRRGKGHKRPHFSVHVSCGQTVHTVAYLSNCGALVVSQLLVVTGKLLSALVSFRMQINQ